MTAPTTPRELTQDDFERRLRLVGNQLAVFESGLNTWMELDYQTGSREHTDAQLAAVQGAIDTCSRLREELRAIVDDFSPAITAAEVAATR